MGMADLLRFDGQRALVVGGATGMGRAAAELLLDLGAEVTVMDAAPVDLDGVTVHKVDLRETDQIDAALDATGGPIHALLNCAGVADGFPGIEKINFLGHRHLIDRALAHDLLPRGASISMISSAAGLAWEKNLDEIKDYLATPDFESGAEWIAARFGKADYMWSKQTICAYVAIQAFEMAKRGLRINAILPGPTDTPLAQANADMWLAFGQDYREAAGIEASTPAEQAYPLVFLASRAASYVNGITMITDAGYISSGVTDAFPPAKPAADFLYGRY